MENHVLAPMPNEEKDLALHVELCHQRYLQLLSKFDAVDERLDIMTETLEEIKANLETQQSKQLRVYLGWASTLIFAMSGWIIHLLTK